MTDLENDIGTALMDLRAAFAWHGVPCPDVLEYLDQAKGYEAAKTLRKSLGPTLWAIGPDAKPWAEVSFAGFTIGFEAKFIERRGSGANLYDPIPKR